MNILNSMDNIFGVHYQELLVWHMIARVIFIYILGIVLVHLNKRFMAIRTAYNFFLFIFIGSLLASSIVGSLFYETVSVVVVIMVLNWFITMLSYYYKGIKKIMAGTSILLVDNGVIQYKNLQKCFIREKELLVLLRIQTNMTDISRVEKSYFEDNGSISFVLKET